HRGVSILYADRHGDAPLLAGRRALARALARHLAAEGFAMYGGEDYAGLYETDPVPGVFIDRRGLFFLRRFAQPSVIIETHQGLSRTERAEWREDATRARFARAVIRALTDIAGRAPPGAKLLAEPVR
ncbi:N-acetylmuramoyl-L-alanine amidase, partial [Myxococcota bacterium]|nr:N-acetylmuramoyl-L-alanine amidase [Myxococcota bacterium]